MSGFQLDTSGEVGPMPGARYGSPGCVIDAAPSFIRWSDLSPFAQGYVEALFDQPIELEFGGQIHANWHKLGFSDLSPEALAMILRDCERFTELFGEWPLREHGEGFWIGRQKDKHPDFPPLTPTLSEDGKVNLVVQAQVGDA